MEEFKNFLIAAGFALAILLTIIASVGAICTGSIYAVAGVCNFGWLYFPVREIERYFKERNSGGATGKGRAKEPVAESKNNIFEEKI